MAKVNASRGILYRICSVYAADREDRDDLYQEMLFQLWRSYASYQGQSSFSTWMYRVTLNTALMHRRKRSRAHRVLDGSGADLEITDPSPAHEDPDVQRLRSCIQQLGGVDRAVILLRLEEKSYQEISDITGLSESNVSVRIVRVKERLRQMLTEESPGGGGR